MAKLNDVLRETYIEVLTAALERADEEVIRTNSNEVAIPVVDAEGNEKYVVFTVKVPTGTRDGEPYDAYEAADGYKLKLAKAEERAEKAKAKKEKDLAKKAKAKAARDAKANA